MGSAVSPFGLLVAAAVVAVTMVASAEEGAGTWEDPHVVDALPYAHGGDTTFGVEVVDTYGCATTLDESGPEVVYAFELDRPGRVTAWVEGDVEGAVDVDVHLLDSEPLGDGAAACLHRGNRVAEADMDAGVGWVSVDTYVTGGVALSGPFVLRVDVVAQGQGRERQVARGVWWRAELHDDLFGGVQSVNVLEVDLAEPGVSVVPVEGEGCEGTSSMAERTGAVAGVNGGFFASGCAPVGLVRIDDDFIAGNPGDRPPRSSLGLGDPPLAVVRPVAGDDSMPEVHHALGGMPGLVSSGAANVTWSEESTGESFTTSRHPRTAACVTLDDHLLFVTFDGRTAAGLGVDLFDLADYLVSLGCDRGLNYDGGGSTAMWVSAHVGYGVVSYPSDNGIADHRGERSVSNGWFVWAEPVNRPPRFTSEPGLEAAEGSSWTYDADALDLDLDPIEFTVVDGPVGLFVDPATGEASWAPGDDQGGLQRVVLGAGDGFDVTEQSFDLDVTVLGADGDADADGDVDGDADGDADADGDGDSPGQTGGCSCHAGGGIRRALLGSMLPW